MAQSSKRIEQLAPELGRIISASEPIHDLADGFGGAQGPAEGPLWWKEGGYLLFSDIHNNRRMKYEPGKGVSLFLEPTNRANGLTRDLQGRLARLRARQPPRHPAGTRRQPHRASPTAFRGASSTGRTTSSSNPTAAIYFTDPWTNPTAPQQWDLTFSGVYRVTPDLGTLTLLVERFRAARTASPSRPTRASSTSTIRGAATSAPSTCCRTARSPGRPTASSPICAAPSPACPTA